MRAQSRSGKKFVVLAALAVVCIYSGAAMAANKLIVKGTDGTTDKFVVTDGGRIGTGTSTPGKAVYINGDSIETTQIVSHATNTGDTALSGGFVARRNNLNTTNNGLPVLGNRIGYMLFGSIGTDLADKNAAGFGAYAEADWTNNSFPAYFAIETAPPSSGRTEKMRITGAGNVGIGTTTPTQKLEINGGIRLNTSTAKPTTCDNSLRGVLYYSQGGAGVADSLEVCAKDASGNYSWNKLY